MTTPFGNPIEGYLHPLGWARPAGNLEMEVTRDAAGHLAANQGLALDINNGRCDGKVLASKAGTVRDVDPLQGIVRIVHPDGSLTGYAHMSPILVARGQAVTQGQQIGEIGDAHDPAITNFSGCHLHFQIQPVANGPDVDPWPYMNGGGDMIPIPGANYTALHNKKLALKVSGNFRNERKSGTPLGPPFPAGTVFYPSAYANDGDVPTGSQSGEWFGGILYVGSGNQFGWFHSSVCGPLQDDVATGGHTDAELMEAAKRAGHNAAVDVAAQAQATAQKYP